MGEGPRSVRVTNEGRLPVTVSNPMIRNDSIVSPNTNPQGMPSNSVGVPVSAASTIEVSRFNPLKTALFVGAAAVASVSWARAVGSGGGSGEPPDPVLKLTGNDVWGSVQAIVGWLR